jgi:hypothetical protein
MNEEKNYLDGLSSPIQKKSIKDIPVPTRNKKDRMSTSDVNLIKHTPIVRKTVTRTTKKDLDLREEMIREDQEETINLKQPIANFIKEQKERDTDLSDFEDEEEINYHKKNKKPCQYSDSGKGFPYLITISSIVALILIFLGVSTLFSNAKVLITPKTSELSNLNIDIPIIDEKVGNKDLLNYKVLEINESATKIVDSEKEEAVENKASGVITVYNEYKTESQKLIQNTRFETADGLVYRIKNSITVPGYTESAGKKTPGSIDVEVFADQAGDKYNIGKTDFKVPGFKGQEQYDFFYAKSKTEMTGGFVGTKNTVSTSTLTTIVKDLQGQITNQILQKIKDQTTDKYTYVYSPETFTFLEAKQNNASGKKVEVALSGTAKIYVVEKAELSKKVAEKGGRDYDGAPVLIKDIDKLAIKIKQNDIEKGKEIIQNNEILNVTGDAVIVWQNDSEQIKKDLAGKDKKELSQIISKYSGITKASASFTLFWNSRFPQNTNKINVEIE